PANFTTLPHFSVSSAMSLPKSAGEPESAVAPHLASRACILGSDSVDFRVELLDDLGWRVARRADAGPEARLVAGHEFRHRRDVWQRRRARRGCYRQRTKFASPHLLDR